MNKLVNSFVLKKIVYISLAIYIFDVILLGTGDLLKFGGVSTRIVFFAIAVLGSIPFTLKNLKNILIKKEILLVAGFGVFVILAAILGVVNKNYMPILVADVKGYLNLLIVLPMLYVLSTKESTIKLLKFILNGISFVAIICIILSYFQFFSGEARGVIYEAVHKYGFASVTILTETAVRVFLHSGTRMLVLGLVLALAFLLIEKNKYVVRYIQMVICVVALYISYARAMYLGLFIIVLGLIVCVAVFYKEYLVKISKTAGLVLVLTVVLIVSLGVTQKSNLFLIGWNRCVVAIDGDMGLTPPLVATGPDASTDTEANNSTEKETENNNNTNNLINMDKELESLDIREYRIKMALDNFSKSPIWGNGLGVVNDLNYYTGIEYFYLDLLSKMGIIGLVLFLAPAMMSIYNIIKQKKEYSETQRLLSLFVWFDLLFMMIISYFNPCMNTSWGLMIYGLAIVLGMKWEKSNFEENKTNV